jgi:hypothetical protein
MQLMKICGLAGEHMFYKGGDSKAFSIDMPVYYFL